MIIEGERRFTSASIRVQFERDATAASLVVGELKEFAPTIPEVITSEQVRDKLTGMRVLCIREKHTTGFRSALERNGFEPAVYEEHFTEHSAEASANPNSLRERVRAHRYVMYAFEGFGHSFGSCLDYHDGVLFKQGRAATCVTDFKKWLLESK